MRHLLWSATMGAAILAGLASSARAQGDGTMFNSTPGLSTVYGAPGQFASTWGVPSFGWPRTYTVFSSPYGPGYGYGYYPYTYFPSSYGFRLWRPGFAEPGYIYGAGYYGTVSTPYMGLTTRNGPPIGAYAPGLGAAPGYAAW